jgi:hypothetical protein
VRDPTHPLFGRTFKVKRRRLSRPPSSGMSRSRGLTHTFTLAMAAYNLAKLPGIMAA